MLAGLNSANHIVSNEIASIKLIKTTHHYIHSTLNRNAILRSNNIRFSIHQLYQHSIRRKHRTFNSGLSEKWRSWGLNANPYKIAGCGFVGGLAGALCGVGGGIVMIPLLRVITSMTAHQVAGTSLVAVAAGALFATANYKLSSDVIRVPIALNMAMFSMAFSVFGARTTSMLSGKWLSIVTASTLMMCIYPILKKYDPTIPPPGHGLHREDMSEVLRKHIEEEKFFQNNRREWYKKNWHFCAIGCISGYLSGLIGIGGGVVMTAAMVAFTDLSQHEAVATSLTCIAPTALIGSLVHYRLNHVVLPIALLLGITCSLGMTTSANMALEVSDANLKLVFSAVLFASSLRMFSQSLLL